MAYYRRPQAIRVQRLDLYDALTWLLLGAGTALSLALVALLAWLVWLGVGEAVRVLGGAR